MHTALAISPHADDAATFCGGTLAKMADHGYHVVLVRVTNDAKASLGLDTEETIERNTRELHESARVMGVAEIVELGYPAHGLGDVPVIELREHFVRLFRKYRPYSVLSFDPFGLYDSNQDHLATARAVDEAFRIACFDKHHPEHFDEGLEPFAVCERWYFARRLREVNHVEDITDWLDHRIEALCSHHTLISNLVHMQSMQLETWGRRVPLLEKARRGDLRPLLTRVLRAQSAGRARQHGLPDGRFAEIFRLERFGPWEELFRETAEPISSAHHGPMAAGIFQIDDDS